MSETGICLGCQSRTRLRLNFCQRCEINLSDNQRVQVRIVAGLERRLEVTVCKLTANDRHQSQGVTKLALALFAVRRFLPEDAVMNANHQIQAWALSLEAERPLLIGRIARQRAAIDRLRRKHGLTKAMGWRP